MDPNAFIPYGRQFIDEDDIKAVSEVLKSDWLTTGPKVEQFENAVAAYTGALHAVAVSSGTAALHCAMSAIGIGPGDEVIVPPMTFAATANCVAYQGGRPVFVDVERDTLLIDAEKIEEKITPRTKAIISVDYAGQPCDYAALRRMANTHGIKLVADSCHALGAQYHGERVGRLADMTVFSFHPVKHITTGEGGMIVTDDDDFAQKMRCFRNHGINSDFKDRQAKGSWYYEMVNLGFNYRITDIQCALGLQQLKKLPAGLRRRREIAGRYDAEFRSMPSIAPLKLKEDILHAYHLYVIKIVPEKCATAKKDVFGALRAKGIGANVHYIPVHLHPFYMREYGTSIGECPVSEEAYAQIISLPLFPAMGDREIGRVIDGVRQAVGEGL